MPLEGRPLLWTISSLTALSFLLIGYDNGVIGGLTGTPAFNRIFDNPDANILSTMVAIYEVGCFFGAIIAFLIGERLGRRKTLAIGAVWMAIGAILQCSAYSRAQFIVARIISGWGMGIINSTAPVLQSEVSPKASRGRYVCAQLSTLNFGIFLSYWLDYGFSKNYTSDIVFRFPVAFQLVFIVPVFVLTFIVPESPRWLAGHGRNEECLDVVTRLAGKNCDRAVVQARYDEIVDGVAYENSIATSSWKALFANDELASRRRLLIACSVQFFQQLGGINGVIYYGVYLFTNSLGFSGDTPGLVAGFLFTWFFVASFIPWFLIDTVGRKPLLVGSVAFMAILFCILTGTIHQVQYNAPNSHACGIVATVAVFLYMGAFTTGNCMGLNLATSYPRKGNSSCNGLQLDHQFVSQEMISAHSYAFSAVVEIFPIAISNIGYKTYILFAVFNAAFVPIMILFYKETKGKSLEEIDLLFGSGHFQNMQEAKLSTKHTEYIEDDSKQRTV